MGSLLTLLLAFVAATLVVIAVLVVGLRRRKRDACRADAAGEER